MSANESRPVTSEAAPEKQNDDTTMVYLAGEWHERHDNWRDQVDLSACDNMTAYAAGRLDGHQQAMTEFREMWQLLLQLDSAWTPEDVEAIAIPRRRGTRPVGGNKPRHLRVVGR